MACKRMVTGDWSKLLLGGRPKTKVVRGTTREGPDVEDRPGGYITYAVAARRSSAVRARCCTTPRWNKFTGWKEKLVRNCHRWILHLAFDGNTCKESAVKLISILNFNRSISNFFLHYILLITKAKLFQRII